jgi:uncharacterized repeat protein (TIGR03803 family)
MLLSRGLLAQEFRLGHAVIIGAALALSGCGGGNGSTAQTYSISGTLSGLTSSGLVLMVNGTPVSVTPSAKTMRLASQLPSGTGYSVTVNTQPTGETCSVAGGTGTISSANVANVVVTCSDRAYSIGGAISGLNGSGLVLANGGDTFTASAGATSFTMPTAVAYTSSYAVSIKTQPPGLACVLSNGTGTMPANAVTNMTVACTDQPFSLGGTIAGLGNNSGLVLANGASLLTVAPGSTSFTMPAGVAFSSSYNVMVQSSPAGLTCSVANGTGTMPASNVASVVIACSDQSYSLGGTITGLAASGLVLTDGTTLSLAAGATSFNMPTAIAFSSPYNLTVRTQPTGETCSVANGSGTMPASNVSNVTVTCSVNTYTIGGLISGLTATGLVLLDNGGDATHIAANATQFSMNTGLASGASYAITVQTQPPGLVCTVTNGSGTVGASDVSTVSIACVSNFTLLYSFSGGSDGQLPYASLVQGSDGNFYGTTRTGGANGTGAVFKITPEGTETVLYSFAGGSDGANPYSSLIQGSDGEFYGTTALGGATGNGTVFKITPAGIETVLYSLAGGSDGANPVAGLIVGSDGNFYGTTENGGTSDYGTVFKITPAGVETVLYSFAGGSDGAAPAAGLVQGSDGNFYGATYAGGNSGTIFKVTPAGVETVLHSFTGGSSDGDQPYGSLVQGVDGNFYGTTAFGGTNGYGTVFKITPSGNETVLYSFAGGSDGAAPWAGLLLGNDGSFYGTTNGGGTAGYGTVFKITPSGTENVLDFFTGTDGEGPWSSVLQGSDGNLYGTTYYGGTNGNGTVFKITLQ